jgi:hypothetical protein
MVDVPTSGVLAQGDAHALFFAEKSQTAVADEQ